MAVVMFLAAVKSRTVELRQTLPVLKPSTPSPTAQMEAVFLQEETANISVYTMSEQAR